MLRVVFMGTPEFSVSTLDAVHREHQIVGVYTQPDRSVGRGLDLKASPVKSRALELGLPVFQPEKLSLPGEFGRLESLRPDVIVVVAYGIILSKKVLELSQFGCVNVHTSLLPRWRGAAPIQWAVLAGDPKTGVTTMRLVEALDAGDILLQREIPITKEDTAKSLSQQLSKLGAELILPTLAGLASGKLKGQAQDSTQVTYAKKLSKEMEWLDPQESAQELDCRVRAFDPWPGTSLDLGVRLKVKRARAHMDISGSPGLIFERSGMVLLGTSQGSLELQVVQWDGKKEVRSAEFLNGLKGQGQKLPLTVQGRRYSWKKG